MRLLWSTEQIEQIRQFGALLHSKGIEYSLDGSIDRNWDQETYGDKTVHLWIQNEDQMEQAKDLLQELLKNPSNPEFQLDTQPATYQMPISPSKHYLEKKLNSKIQDLNTRPSQPLQKAIVQAYVSKLLILICSAILLLDLWYQNTQTNIPKPLHNMLLTASPVEKALLYDYPISYELLDKIIALYGYEALLHPESLPPDGKELYQEHIAKAPWTGFYPQAVAFLQDVSHVKQSSSSLPSHELLFEKIRKGELWRAITPVLLHGDLLHLFFNMVWILILGVQIEGRIGIGKYIAFIAAVAIVSNTIQYLMCGPAFLGFSGVVCGMAFFIRARQKKASWEGYQMASATFHFIVFFVGILAGLSTLTFLLESFRGVAFPIQIANTAHLAGAGAGWVLGHFTVFGWNRFE